MRGASPSVVVPMPVSEFVILNGGLALPVPALQLAWSLEDRRLRLSVDRNRQIVVEPTVALTDQDRAGIRRWRLHLAAIAEYNVSGREGL